MKEQKYVVVIYRLCQRLNVLQMKLNNIKYTNKIIIKLLRLF